MGTLAPTPTLTPTPTLIRGRPSVNRPSVHQPSICLSGRPSVNRPSVCRPSVCLSDRLSFDRPSVCHRVFFCLSVIRNPTSKNPTPTLLCLRLLTMRCCSCTYCRLLALCLPHLPSLLGPKLLLLWPTSEIMFCPYLLLPLHVLH